MTEFLVAGGFKIPIRKLGKFGREIDKAKLKEFWIDIGNVAEMRGCYVFAMRAGKGETPYYVGKAARQPFKKECFAPHKRADHYNPILGDRKGTPYMWFIYQRKVKGKWSASAIEEIEDMLVATAAIRNPKLSNIKKRGTRKWSIRGVTKGKASKMAGAFREIVGFN